MQTISQSFSLLWNALFLQPDAYASMRDEESPTKKGVVILIILGLAVALANFIGVTLSWATSPSLTAIKDTIFEIYQRMPWWQFIEAQPEAMTMFQQVWDQVWQIMGYIVPTPVSSLSGFITKPLGLILVWLIYGLVAYLFARMLGGSGTLSQTLGATSLAAAPQLLLLLTVLPYVVVAGIGTWVLICRYMALRVTHNLSWARTLWATVLPLIALGIITFLIALSAALIAAPIMAQMFGEGF